MSMDHSRNQIGHIFLPLSQIEYIQSILAKHNTRFDWYLNHQIDEQTGGRYGQNYTR